MGEDQEERTMSQKNKLRQLNLRGGNNTSVKNFRISSLLTDCVTSLCKIRPIITESLGHYKD